MTHIGLVFGHLICIPARFHGFFLQCYQSLVGARKQIDGAKNNKNGKFLWNARGLQNFPQGITEHRVECIFDVDKGNVSRFIHFFRFFDDWTNWGNVFGCTSSSSETSSFTAAVVVEGWSYALQKDHCKQLSRDGDRVLLCRDGLSIPPCFLCSSKRENDSPSPIIGDDC